MIPIVLDLCKEFCNTRLSPISSNDGQNVAENIRLCDGPVNVRDHNLVRPLPEVEVTAAPCSPLVSCCDAELDFIHAGLQVQAALEKYKLTL